MQRPVAAAITVVVGLGVVSCSSKAPATVAPTARRAAESCHALDYGTDGTVGPVLCPDGAANQLALDYFRTKGFTTVDLDADATPVQVKHALCADLMGLSVTIPVVQEAYRVGNAINRWSFAPDPSADASVEACPSG